MRRPNRSPFPSPSMSPWLMGGVLGLLGLLPGGCSFKIEASDGVPCSAASCDGGVAIDGQVAGDLLSAPVDVSLPGPRGIVSFPLSAMVGTATLALTVTGPSEDQTSLSTTGAPFPVVIFSPERAVPRARYQAYADRLASFGIVCVAQDPRDAGNIAQYRSDTIALVGWLGAPTGQDAGRITGRIDAAAAAMRLGITGHGLGGKIALLAAEGEARIKAVLVLDPVDEPTLPAGPGLSALRLLGPLVLVGETASQQGMSGNPPCAPDGQDYLTLYQKAVSPAMATSLIGAGHDDFLDDCAGAPLLCDACKGGGAPRDRTHALAVKYTTAYFAWLLSGAKGAGDFLMGPPFLQDMTQGLASSFTK